MPTPYSDIYIKFNSIVQDNNLLSILTENEYNDLLEIFLSKARSVYFKNCKKDLSDIDNILKQFNETLDEQEQWIIASSMRMIWLNNMIYKENKLREKLSTKDYTIHSPGNLLDKLILLKKETKQELDEMIVSYSFDKFEGFN